MRDDVCMYVCIYKGVVCVCQLQTLFNDLKLRQGLGMRMNTGCIESR